MSFTSQRIITVLGILIIIVSVAIGAYYAYEQGYFQLASDPDIEPQKVKITNVTHSEFTVSWVTTKASQGAIKYGTAKNSLVSIQIDDQNELAGQPQIFKLHHATVTNLDSKTPYYFEILSGEKNQLYDNNGQPYEITTASSLGTLPPPDLASGTIELPNGKPAEGAIVYLNLPDVYPLSTQVKTDGSWLINLSNARSANLNSYATYDQASTKYELTVLGTGTVSNISTITANDSPLPKIVLGNTYDFTKPVLADLPVDEADLPAQAGSQKIAADTLKQEKKSQFSIEPLEEATQSSVKLGEILVSDESEVVILNPEIDYEELYTNRPEFLGSGPTNTVLTLQISAVNMENRGTTIIDSEGSWSYVPNISLSDGTHLLEVTYADSEGTTQTLNRHFVISSSASGGNDLPAFEATPSATPTSTPSPSSTPRSTSTPRITTSPTPVSTVSASPRVLIPSTQSGIPQPGVSWPTYLVLIAGAILISSGLYSKSVVKK